MPQTLIHALWFVREYHKAAKRLEDSQTKGDNMKFAMEEKNSVLVKIQTKKRDNRETVEELHETTGKPTGKKIPNKNKGKFIYETYDNIELFEATETEVKEAVMRGLNSAAERSASAKK